MNLSLQVFAFLELEQIPEILGSHLFEIDRLMGHEHGGAEGGLAMALSITAAGRLLDRFAAYSLIVVGLLCFAVSFLLIGSGVVVHSFAVLAVLVALGRIGLGMTIPSLNLGALQLVESPQLAQASGTLNFIRQLGGAIGVNVLTIFFSWLDAGGREHGLDTAAAMGKAFSVCFMVVGLVFLLAVVPAMRMQIGPAEGALGSKDGS